MSAVTSPSANPSVRAASTSSRRSTAPISRKWLPAPRVPSWARPRSLARAETAAGSAPGQDAAGLGVEQVASRRRARARLDDLRGTARQDPVEPRALEPERAAAARARGHGTGDLVHERADGALHLVACDPRA